MNDIKNKVFMMNPKLKKIISGIILVPFVIAVGFFGSMMLYRFLIRYAVYVEYSSIIYGALGESLFLFILFYLLSKLRIHPYKIAFLGFGYGIAEQLVNHYILDWDMSHLKMWMYVVTTIVMALLFEKSKKEKTPKYRFYTFMSAFLIHLVFILTQQFIF